MRYLILLFLVVSCASTPRKPAVKLFPYGTYHHNIHVKTKDKEISFVGINQWTEEKFVVVGLGPLDMTMIKYEENKKTKARDLYINKEMVPITDERAYDLVALMKEMYSWDSSICKKKVCREGFWGVPVFLYLNDEEAVNRIQIIRGDVNVNVDVTSYEKIL